jgi:hypothetical protein
MPLYVLWIAFLISGAVYSNAYAFSDEHLECVSSPDKVMRCHEAQYAVRARELLGDSKLPGNERVILEVQEFIAHNEWIDLAIYSMFNPGKIIIIGALSYVRPPENRQGARPIYCGQRQQDNTCAPRWICDSL